MLTEDGEPHVQHTIGIAEMMVSSNLDDILVTYSLGSCVGVAIYDPEAHIGGLIHCMLPLSKSSPDKAKQNPMMFTDTGVSRMLQQMFDMGADRKRMVAKVAGAAVMLDDKGMFKIGERNHTVLRKVLWKNNILISAEDVGGTIARTMSLHLDDGRTMIKSNGVAKELR